MATSVDPAHLQALGLDQAKYEKLTKLRAAVQDILKPEHDDFYLVRWLRARQFDLKKAEDMLRKHMEWRIRYDVDNILTSWKRSEVLERYDIGGKCGYTKDGQPLWIYVSAKLDTKGMQCSVPRREMIKQYIHKMESAHRDFKEQSAKLGRRVDKAVMISDMEGFGWSDIFKPGMDVILRLLGMVEANYPESLSKAYVINAPSAFPMIFNIAKPFIHEETRKRVQILGADWKERLLAEVDADQLPVHWGGTKTDPQTGDEYCSTLVHMGGEIPTEYYLRGPDLVDPSLVKSLAVGAGSSEKVEFTVARNRVQIRYTFWTNNYDINFSVTRKNSDGTVEEVVKANKYNSHLIPEDGLIQCKEPAIYVFKFDNTYSWLQSKEVFYALQIVDTEHLAETPQ